MTCWNRVIKLLMHLKMVLFLLNILSDAAAHGYVLKDVNDFIQEIESMSENLYQIYSMSFFELSPVDYVKELINIKNAVENKENVAVIKDRISGLKD